MACSIETFLDLNTLSLEELSGRLSAVELRGSSDQEASGRLLLTEEEWSARQQHRAQGSSSGSKGPNKPKPQGGDKNSAPPRAGNCRYCGKAGHWAKEC
jgi:hypothetical protein